MKSDIEISYDYANKYKDITKIAKKLGIKSKYIESYCGDKFAKIKLEANDGKKQGKLVLVTAISPTKAGEGKTTVSIGLADSLNKLGKKTALALREPSMGPVFGLKGGATGGGYAQVFPMEDINLHFTGDMHAITAANNLIAACVDNYIYSNNELNIQRVTFERCLDINDRQLRTVKLANLREDHFNLTVASELMAIFCLAKDIEDLRTRIGNIIVGYTYGDVPIFVHDLNIQDSVVMLLKDAIKPNLAQTLYQTPAFIHGGPFANIAHGCNSIIATKMAMNYADYTITEGGFGADLGAQKFFDIVCPNADIYPDTVVLVASIRALKLHGGAKYEDLDKENIDALLKGLEENLLVHVNNITNIYKVPVIIALNKFDTDLEKELNIFNEFCNNHLLVYSLVTSFTDGNIGALNLARFVINSVKNYSKRKQKEMTYVILKNRGLTIKERIEWLCHNIYHVNNIIYPSSVLTILDKLESMSFQTVKPKNYFICMAKTPYALNDGNSNKTSFTITDIHLCNGAKFIVVKSGSIMTMPGLPKKPLATKITFKDNIIKGMI